MTPGRPDIGGTWGDEIRRHVRTLLLILAVAALYYGSARLGLILQLVRGQVTPLWPPTGVGVAALLVLGLRIWPGIALGAFVANVSLGPSALAVLGITAGNTLAPVCAVLLLHQVGFRRELDRLRDALALIFLGALGAMLISATVGAGVLGLSDALRPGGFWPTWSVWWTGDAMGVLVVAPVLLVLHRAHWPVRASGARWAEACALAVGSVGVTYGVTSTSSSQLLFLVFPFLLWAAFRFALAGAAPCALAVSTVAILASAREAGPFGHHGLLANMITLQAFNGVTALTALLLSAMILERNRTNDEIRRIVERLSGLAPHLGPGGATRLPLPQAGTDGRRPGGEGGRGVPGGDGDARRRGSGGRGPGGDGARGPHENGDVRGPGGGDGSGRA